MEPCTIALFGESNKGEFSQAYFCKNLAQLSDAVGEPPSQASKGLSLAIQALLFDYSVLFFRVKEEGYSRADYLSGLRVLQQKQKIPTKLAAVCLPGVGDMEIIEATNPICYLHNSFLIFTEQDLYDYLTY